VPTHTQRFSLDPNESRGALGPSKAQVVSRALRRGERFETGPPNTPWRRASTDRRAATISRMKARDAGLLARISQRRTRGAVPRTPSLVSAVPNVAIGP
jgi:hypothetical protein